MPTRRATLFSLLLMIGAVPAGAGEMLVQGEVVRVVPIHGQSQVVDHLGECNGEKPSSGDLAALLAWDLRAGCRTVTRSVDVVEGYRVYYRWDGRLYKTVMAEPPTDTIPLRVHVH